MTAYEVSRFSASDLSRILDEGSHESRGYSELKSHLSYLDEYLTKIGARTILIENPYTDRDYLEDYAAYYARCHANYSRRCRRLHFFSSDLDDTVFGSAIEGCREAVSTLQNHYLGFIVVKPLPSTVIGRTCLVTYGNIDSRSRSFPTTRKYDVHLFGIALEVVSLPFQEQDTDVAACATSALWSVFNATGHLFQHHIPSPAEITKAASATHRLVNRTLPAGDGLTAEQMADAIRSVGLEPHYVNTKPLDLMLISARAYLSAGIPCLLMGAINDGKQVLGHHAVALTGYSDPEGPSRRYDKTLFKGTSIGRLYAHDDQVGPFSRIKIEPSLSRPLITSWRDKNDQRGNITFDPSLMLVPLYHKIRVPFISVLRTVVELNAWLEIFRNNSLLPLTGEVEWDILLTENALFKSSVYSDSQIAASYRKSILTHDLPKYIWRIRANCAGRPLFDLLFDATDLLQGGHEVEGLPYDLPTCRAIGAISANSSVSAAFRRGARGSEHGFEWFAKNVTSF